MAVDCHLFVLHTFGPFTEASFAIDRNRELFPELERMAVPLGGGFQLPKGSWSGYADGTCPKRRKGLEERGWLLRDSYGTPIRTIAAEQLPALDDDSRNAAIFAFIRTHYAGQRVVVFLS